MPLTQLFVTSGTFWRGDDFTSSPTTNHLLVHFGQIRRIYSPREMRHLDYLLQFTSDIGHLKGTENIPADAMFRTINAFFLIHAQTWQNLWRSSLKIRSFRTYFETIQLSWSTCSEQHVLNSNLDIVCDTSTGKIRPFVPESFRRVFFSSLHNLSHPDANASIKLMTERYVWPQMKSDIRLWARTCKQCQKAQVGRHTRTPVDPFPSPDERFEHVHIDITCPLPPCKGYTYLLTCVDRFSR